jgi:cytochrome c-type biogenesis protein CcmH
VLTVRTLRFLAVALLLALPQGALAVAVDPPMDDPALEARAQALFADLRCLVCQNQSISDSNADLARDLRMIVRERIAAGNSDIEARSYLVDRYGDWVLLKPPVKAATWVLWFGPLVLLALAGWLGFGLYRRRGPRQEEARPLDVQEQERLKLLLKDTDDT